MLSREVMGALALAILWVNTLLIAAAALKRAAELGRMRRAFGAVAKGTVVTGDGPAGALAALEIEQVGRLSAGANPQILFHDRAHACRIFGGRVAFEGGAEVDVAPAEEGAEVWIDAPSVARPAGCPSEAAFDAACSEARKARGFSRSVSTPILAGEKVFLAPANGARAGLVSKLDPRTWIARRTALAYAFAGAEVLVAAACTAASLQAPLFGTVSTAGAAAGLVFFLLVQPAGTSVRDALRPPSRAPRHDQWTRPAVKEPSPEASRSPS
jgi:hypothetical protein